MLKIAELVVEVVAIIMFAVFVWYEFIKKDNYTILKSRKIHALMALAISVALVLILVSGEGGLLEIFLLITHVLQFHMDIQDVSIREKQERKRKKANIDSNKKATKK